MNEIKINTLMENQILHAILEKGTYASSGDNMQPWKFKITEDAIHLWVVPNPAGHFFETGYRTLYISAGGVIENMRVAATKHGYALDVVYFPDREKPTHVAKITFNRKPELETHPHDAVLHARCTNRKLYDPGRIIPDNVYERINESVGDDKAHQLLWIKRGDEKYESLTKVMAEGDQLRFQNKRIHLEFMECIRYGKNEVERTKDGLDIQTLEAGPGASLIFKLLSSWKTVSFLNGLGFSKQFYRYTVDQMKSSQAAGLIVAPTHSAEDYVKGGEVMQRVWNEVAFHGLSMQPMEGIPVFLINLALEGDQTFTESQKEQVANIRDRFLSHFEITDKNGLILLFRLGYAEAPTARSLRRPVESFIES